MSDTLEKIRREKLQSYQWQYSYQSKNTIVQIKDFSNIEENTNISISGRITAIRTIGKITFVKLSNTDGTIQVILNNNTNNYDNILKIMDVGDFFTAEGVVGLSKTNEKSVIATDFIARRKALLPLPDKWNKLTEPDIIRRKRYLDIITSQETRCVFETRLKLIFTIRQFLTERGYVEVETPILQNIASGAAAAPFKTHHNALDTNYYLRVAPELYLKRLTIAGYPKIFEIGKCFRNEGVDSTHLQEFTMLEMYTAFMSYKELQDIGCEMVLTLINSVRDKKLDNIPRYQYNAFMKKNGLDIDQLTKYEHLIPLAKEHNIDYNKYPTYDILLDQLYKKMCVKKITDPILIYDYPAFALAKKSDTDPRYSEQFQIIMEGCEISNAYLEQNDPDIQQDEFNKQIVERAQGNMEAIESDSDYIEALKHGLPPTGGLGLGLDRIIQIITQCSSIRDIVFFPNVKNK